MDKIPTTYQDISSYLSQPNANPFLLRKLTIDKIEQITGTALVSYVARTSVNSRTVPISIDEEDIIGFSDLIVTTPGENLDVFLVSNGGSPESAERIIKLLRGKYKKIRFFITGNAYSAATMMCFASDEIVMHRQGTLGPIDPQIGGIPAHSILESFEEVQDRLKKEGPASLTAYMPLIAKYDLHLLNLCKRAQELSEQLTFMYLKDYMKKDEKTIKGITDFFMDHGIHKTHGRSIDRDSAAAHGLNIIHSEDISPDFDNLLLSLFNQYQFFFGQSYFYKLYENSRGINWGKSNQPQQLQLPIAIPNFPFPGAPKPKASN